MAHTAAARNLVTVLMDAGHTVADLYEAVTTPHFFLIDEKGFLRYRGAADDTAFHRREPTVHYLKDAVDALLNGCAIVRHHL